MSDGSTCYRTCSILSRGSSIRLGDKLTCSCGESSYESFETPETS
jgi:hypothetical protein